MWRVLSAPIYFPSSLISQVFSMPYVSALSAFFCWELKWDGHLHNNPLPATVCPLLVFTFLFFSAPFTVFLTLHEHSVLFKSFLLFSTHLCSLLQGLSCSFHSTLFWSYQLLTNFLFKDRWMASLCHFSSNKYILYIIHP